MFGLLKRFFWQPFFVYETGPPSGGHNERGAFMNTINGYIDHIIYQNAENGYTVLELTAEGEDIICVGTCPGLGQGETVELEGDYIEHQVYGRQFKFTTCRITVPQDAAGMERYLASGAIKGIGLSLAARIVKQFGSDTFRIIEEEPERLAEVKGISVRKAQEIAAQMEEKRDLRDAMIFLQQYGISNTYAIRIYETYGPQLYSVMRENPYRLAEDITGIGFKLADEIAQKAGILVDSGYRIRSGLIYTLLQATYEGHCFLPREELLDKAAALLGIVTDSIGVQLDNLMMDKKVIIRDNAVFSPGYFYAERNCASMLAQINVPMEEAEYLPSQTLLVEGKIRKLVRELQMELDELQTEAVMSAVRNGLFILSGGPGTGKTTTINVIIRYFDAEGLDILLAAPTGRAAKRMTEATGYEAKTLHRLLELNSGLSDDTAKRVRFERNEENPLEADVIIIDEMSMVDISLFQALLKAVTPGTRLILVGDVNQLPSVGPGQVLRDLIQSRCFPTVELKKIFRQSKESDIIINAHRINNGEQIALDNKSMDFFFLERGDVNVIYKHMIQLIREKLPPYVRATPFDIQVLTPMRKGSLGCETLNTILQQYLNPPSPSKREHTEGSRIFREGDKVMQIRNNYQLEWEIVSKYGIPVDKGSGIFNGDMGKVTEINENAASVVVEFDEGRRVTYPFSLLEELELSYAVTIHKSQGSEYPAVIIPLLGGPRQLLHRNLLYTAITRAKHCVTILGSSETVRSMIANSSEHRRYTMLAARIKEMYE